MSKFKKLFFPLYGITALLLAVIFYCIYTPMYRNVTMYYGNPFYCFGLLLFVHFIFGVGYGLCNLIKFKETNTPLKFSVVNLLSSLVAVSLIVFSLARTFKTGKYLDGYHIWDVLVGFYLMNIRTEKRSVISGIIFSLVTLTIPFAVSLYQGSMFQGIVMMKFNLHDPINFLIYFVFGIILALYTLYPKFKKQGKWTVNIYPMIVGATILILSVAYFVVCCLMNFNFGWTFNNCVCLSGFLMFSSFTKSIQTEETKTKIAAQ